ncbi:uncharacterized protein LOC105027882 isoform X1 [Esox lucius]|uniref:uncharacterized protein LOC105027882 isoform X1 n=1 Tax=Esox lucius TaxID=8010 RepID=UPI0014777AAE|nr:uncharacterized protein LOC105027882 isoform X1 [Esox lucius]XP_034142853.1 uncharacterized protein LOC105027882 isoform X1 [Esox lucius]
MSKLVMATLLSWDLLSVVIILDLVCAESSKNITAIIPKNATAALGETVTLQCDGPANAVIWKRETLSFTTFSHRFWKNETTFNNLTSERMSIDPVNPLVLKIHNVQLTDTGNYSCIITGDRGVRTTKWSLTITDPNDEYKGTAGHSLQDLQDLLYIIPPAIIGSALCILVCCVVWWYRKRQQDRSEGLQDTEVEDRNAQSNIASGQRAQRLQRQYFERINSIYGQKQAHNNPKLSKAPLDNLVGLM